MQRAKKAKMAHEKVGKAGQATSPASRRGEYGLHRVLSLVEWPAGSAAAVVELDAAGTRALVSRAFVAVDPATGDLRPGTLACPATYSPAARAQAVAALASFESAAESAVTSAA